MATTAAGTQALSYIEATFNAILSEISRPTGDGTAIISLSRIVSATPYYDDRGCLRWHIASRQVNYHFPGKIKDEAWRFGEFQVSYM
jgi:hypothetical protein